MTDTDAGDLILHEPKPSRARVWQAVIGLAGLAAITIAAVTTVNDARGKALPGPWALGGALLLNALALAFGVRAWTALFPPTLIAGPWPAACTCPS